MKRPTPSPPAENRPGVWDGPGLIVVAALLLGGALLAAWSNSFSVPFLLDDDVSIAQNPTIRRLATALFPPTNSGSTVSGRPLLNLTFAVNHRLGGTAVSGYHAGNLLIHFAAALCLFGVVRRTLRSPALAVRFGAAATPLAWLITALWALHPLQTESVTYIVQRAESLVGLCYLFTLYAFIRSMERPSRLWAGLTIAACFLGMAAKEVMASAPLVLLLYDRTFVSGTFREAWQRHRRLHLALASSWLLLLGLVLASGGRGSTVGFQAVTWLEYAFTQGPGVATYLRRAIYPASLVFDYGAIIEKRPAVVLAGLLAVFALLAGTIYLLKRRPAAGFLGAWFFLILAPTSSVIPVASQTLAEHRMYLPLAAVIVMATLLLHNFRARLAWAILPLLVLAAGVATFNRNHDYRSGLALWEDTVRKVPDNARALNNLGVCYREAGRRDDAIRCFSDAVAEVPQYATATSNLGVELVRQALDRPVGGPPDAAGLRRGFELLERASGLEPANPLFHATCGQALMDAKQVEAALPHFERALELAPDEPVHHFNYANALSELGRHEAAASHYLMALRHAPPTAEYLTNYGILLRRMKRLPESLEQLRAAAQLAPGSARVRSNLGVSLLASGRTDEGIQELNEAIRLDPRLPQARYNLGNALAEAGRTAEAIEQMETLLRLTAPTAELLSNLGVLYARAGKLPEAVARLQRALELDPGHAAARENLAKINAYLPR